jgi:hypothetical protein
MPTACANEVSSKFMNARRPLVSSAHDTGRIRGGVLPKFMTVMVALAALAAAPIFIARQSDQRPLRDGSATAVATSARPALTDEEERYIRALWSIHGDVERNAMRLSLGQIFYKTNDLGAPELKARVEQALSVYKNAKTRIQGLDAPASLRAEHDDYLAAVRLFEESANEIMKMFNDGRDDHLVAAYPKGQAGADKIREIGGKFWPNEFPPH